MNLDRNELQPYRNLAAWTQDEWQALDIVSFILANYRRYLPIIARRTRLRKLTHEQLQVLPGLICDVAWKPLKTLHERHRDAEGERRNQLMLGTLKAICGTRVVEALGREFQAHTSLDRWIEEVRDDGSADDWTALVAPASASVDESHGDEDMRLAVMLEWLRAQLTRTQFEYLQQMLCEGLDFNDIAARSGSSITNVRVVMLHARERMLALMPEDMAQQWDHLRHRRPAQDTR